ncbi:hypothetical protein V6N13_074811 [Hibiscus sabdariffa]|uniref:Uncharacterized protein n=1 Tax=Hibiscus sabdariffa TaxID=183260 RepID=A0ABR2UA04_9ROSI
MEATFRAKRALFNISELLPQWQCPSPITIRASLSTSYQPPPPETVDGAWKAAKDTAKVVKQSASASGNDDDEVNTNSIEELRAKAVLIPHRQQGVRDSMPSHRLWSFKYKTELLAAALVNHLAGGDIGKNTSPQFIFSTFSGQIRSLRAKTSSIYCPYLCQSMLHLSQYVIAISYYTMMEDFMTRSGI